MRRLRSTTRRQRTLVFRRLPVQQRRRRRSVVQCARQVRTSSPSDALGGARGVGLNFGSGNGFSDAPNRTWNLDVYTSWTFYRAFALYGRLGYAQSGEGPARDRNAHRDGRPTGRRLRDGVNYGLGVRYDMKLRPRARGSIRSLRGASPAKSGTVSCPRATRSRSASSSASERRIASAVREIGGTLRPSRPASSLRLSLMMRDVRHLHPLAGLSRAAARSVRRCFGARRVPAGRDRRSQRCAPGSPPAAAHGPPSSRRAAPCGSPSITR
jgi:hypothetical protein